MQPALEHFTTLYSNADEGYLVLFCPRMATKTHWFDVKKELEAAANKAAAMSPNTDVYFGVGLQRDGAAAGSRGTADGVVSIPGLWADIDVGPNDNGKRRFETQDDALTFLDSLPHKPSLVVSSGGGLHAYWLFREPLHVDAGTRGLLKGWESFLQAEARERYGVHIDSVSDLARVLRVPGTINHKPGGENRVVRNVPPWAHVATGTVEGGGVPRYNPSDFETWREAGQGPPRPAAGAFELRDHAEPPAEKLVALLTVDKRFQHTWEGRRTDRDLKDKSPSGYCLALANTAIAYGWTDQEVADLIIAWRRKHGHDTKTNRRDWYERTIGAARVGHEEEVERVEAVGAVAEAMTHGETFSEDGRKKLLEHVQAATGVPIQGIVRYSIRDESGYVTSSYFVVDIAGDKVMTQNVENLMVQHQFRRFIAEHVSTVPKKMNAAAWEVVSEAMLTACSNADAATEQNFFSEMRSILLRMRHELTETDDLERALAGLGSWRNPADGKLYFQYPHLAGMLRGLGVKTSNNVVAATLKAIGCEPKKLDVQRPGRRRVQANLWSFPS